MLTWMSSNMADGNQQKHLLPSFAIKAGRGYFGDLRGGLCKAIFESRDPRYQEK